jgi:group I intron endonuclease
MLIYLIRNTVNGKAYVGQTIRTLEERWHQHKQQGIHRYKNDALHNALLKYGIDAFEIAVLDDSASTLDELNALEKFHIKAQGTLSPHGYNLTTGGFSYQRSAETLAKMSAALKGRKMPESMRQKLRAANTGRKCSPETRAKISAATKGREGKKGFKHSHETIARMSAAQKGHPVSPQMREKLSVIKKGKALHSPETRAKIGAASRGNSYSKGLAPANKGNKMSEEQRAKLREAWKIRKARPGHVHPLLGHHHSEETKVKIRAARARQAARQREKVIHAVA